MPESLERRASLLLSALFLTWAAGWWLLWPQGWHPLFYGSELLRVEAGEPTEAGRRAPTTLGRFQTDAAGDLAIEVELGAGRASSLLLLEPRTGAVVDRLRMARRIAPQVRHFVVRDLPPSTHYRLALSDSGAGVERITVHALSPLNRAVLPIYAAIPFVCVLGFARRSRGGALDDLLGGGPALTWLDAAAATLLFSCTLVPFQAARVIQMEDAKYLTAVSHSLLTEGDLDVSDRLGMKANGRRAYTLKEHGDRVYHFFSHAPAVLNAPLVALFDALGASVVTPDGAFLSPNEVRVLRFSAALVSAALCVALFLIARAWLPPLHSLALTLVFAFGSQIFSTLSRPYWSHTWATLLLAIALLLLVRPASADRAWGQVLVGTALSWAFFCRPTFSVAVVAVVAYVAVRHRRALGALVGTGAAWLALLVAHSHSVYGQLLPPYLLSSHLRSGRIASEEAVGGYPEALLGTLVSPGRGLFVYVPIALVALVLAVRGWHRLPNRPLAIAGFAALFLHWQIVSSFRTWWGGWCYGPRLFSDVIPWIFLLAALGIAAWRASSEEDRRRPGLTAFGLLAVAFSLFVNIRGATDPETRDWRLPQTAENSSTESSTAESASSAEEPPRFFRHTKLWSWRYPQFMAGLIEPPGGQSSGQSSVESSGETDRR